MKKYFLLIAILFTAFASNAQNEQKKTNVLAKEAVLKFQAEVASINTGKLYEVFENYYKAKAPLTVGMPQSEIIQKDNMGGFDTINEKRNETLKQLLSTATYASWIQVAKTFTQSIVEVN